MLQAQANLMNASSLPAEQSRCVFHLHENTHIYSHMRSSRLWFCWSKTNLFPLALHSSVWECSIQDSVLGQGRCCHGILC